MTDEKLEKVIKGLECCGYTCFMDKCQECPYDGEDCFKRLKADALALLKVQEPKPPIIKENSYGWKFYYCPYEEVADHVTSVSVCATAQQAIGQTDFKRRCLEDIRNAPSIDAISVEWLDAQIRGYASALKSTELKALVLVKQMWQKEQEAR